LAAKNAQPNKTKEIPRPIKLTLNSKNRMSIRAQITRTPKFIIGRWFLWIPSLI